MQEPKTLSDDPPYSNTDVLSPDRPYPSVEIPPGKEDRTTGPVASKPDPAPVMCPASPISPTDPNYTLASIHSARHPCDFPPSPTITSQPHPRTQSPALSIFERSVQEDIIPAEASPSIPSHIRTENHIPPVLEDASAAITDDHAGPEPIEIITSNTHQHAGFDDTASQSLSSSWPGENLANPADFGKCHFPYGVQDSADIRRLSFISFADVINAENAETAENVPNRDSFQAATCWNNSGATGPQNRSPSPLQSPTLSYGLGTSPPTSISASFKGLESSLHRSVRDPGSPLPIAPSPPFSNLSGEIDTEKSRQMLNKARSKDMGSVKSRASSTAGNDEIGYSVQ